MKKILLISQYFNFKESNTTAISIHSRINGVKNKFDFDVYCFFESGNWNEYNLNPLTRIHWRASLVPAAAVIPAPIAYI